MKKVWLLTIAFALAPGAALAQDPTAPADTAPSDTTSPDTTTTSAPVEEPAPVVEEEPAAEEEAEESNWYDNLSIGAYADAYYMVDWNMPEVGTASQGVIHRG